MPPKTGMTVVLFPVGVVVGDRAISNTCSYFLTNYQLKNAMGVLPRQTAVPKIETTLSLQHLASPIGTSVSNKRTNFCLCSNTLRSAFKKLYLKFEKLNSITKVLYYHIFHHYTLYYLGTTKKVMFYSHFIDTHVVSVSLMAEWDQ